MPAINPFSIMAVLYVTVGLFFAGLKGLSVIPHMPEPANLNWLRVHVITIGTITQFIFGSLPGILARKFGFAARTPGETWLQWGLLNGGFLLVVAGLVGVDSWTAAIGAGLVFAAVWRLLGAIVTGWRESGYRWRESLRFYATAPFYLLVGIVMAVSLLFNWWAPGGSMGILEAHVHANVWGFLALIVAGMLFDLFPALVKGPVAKPGWIGRIYYLLNIGAVGLVVGPWVNLHAITIGGLILYFVGTFHVIINLLLTLRIHRVAPPAAMQMLLAYLWMVVPAFFAPFILLAPKAVPGPAIEAAATQGLVNGWVMGMVMGALPRALRTRGGGSNRSLFGRDGDAPDGSWVSVVALNVGVALVWATALVASPILVQSLTISGYSLIVLAWIPFLRRIWITVAAPSAVQEL